MSIYQTHKPGGGSGDFLKLRDGDSVKMRIASDPAVSVYKEGDKPRYSWAIFNRDANKAQVYSAGVSVFKQIAALVEDWGEPTDFDIRIGRTGTGINDTEYIVTPVKTSKDLTKEEKEQVETLDLIKLTKGKWLRDYEEDGVLPDPVMGADNFVDAGEPLPGEEDAPVSLDDLPASF